MSEYQVRTRLYDPPEAVRRIDSKLACWKLTVRPVALSGEDLRKAFEERLDGRARSEPRRRPTPNGPRIRLMPRCRL